MRKRAAISEVISSIILSGVVLTIGGMLWAYSLGASTVIADNYINGTLSLVDEITERFAVEHVNHTSDYLTVNVWVYNYGDVDIIVDLYVTEDTGNNGSYIGLNVAAGSIECKGISMAEELTVDNEVTIEVYSRRQNIVYYRYWT